MCLYLLLLYKDYLKCDSANTETSNLMLQSLEREKKRNFKAIWFRI